MKNGVHATLTKSLAITLLSAMLCNLWRDQRTDPQNKLSGLKSGPATDQME
jgi:hypothetical protein